MEKRIKIVDGIDVKELFGNLDINMKLVREATGVDVVQRGDELVLICESDLPDRDLTGVDMSEMQAEDREEAMELAERIIAEFINLLKSGETIDRQRAAYIVNLTREGVSYQVYKTNNPHTCFLRFLCILLSKGVRKRIWLLSMHLTRHRRHGSRSGTDR